MQTKIFNKNTLLNAAKTYGTPVYCYSEQKITDQYTSLKSALKGLNAEICYAVKANSNSSILKLMNDLGCSFDIVSGGELSRVLRVSNAPSKVVFAGVGKTKDEIAYALKRKIRFFNVESYEELTLIESVAKELNLVANVSFRINPDIYVDTHPYLTTGLHSSKFGIPIVQLTALYDFVEKSKTLNLVGVDCHLGSQLGDLNPLEIAYREVIKYADIFRSKGAEIQWVDCGGGLAVSFSGHYSPLPIDDFGKMCKKILKDKPYTLLLEPGKFLVAESGALVTKVIYVKNNGSKKFVVTDAGMNDLIRPTLYQAFHHIEVLDKDNSKNLEVVDVVGPICESGCYFAQDRELPKIESGDALAICDAGAYGFAMASNYNSRPFPPEVLIEKNEALKLIRKRQSIEDLWKDEII